MEDLEAYIRAKYELGSFKAGGDGKLAKVAASSAAKQVRRLATRHHRRATTA